MFPFSLPALSAAPHEAFLSLLHFSHNFPHPLPLSTAVMPSVTFALFLQLSCDQPGHFSMRTALSPAELNNLNHFLIPVPAPGPAQGFFLLKRSFSLPLLHVWGQTVGFCEAPKDNFDINRPCISEDDLENRIEFYLLKHQVRFTPPKKAYICSMTTSH